MATKDLSSNIAVVPVLGLQEYKTGEDGEAEIDVRGFESVTLIAFTGDVTDEQALVVSASGDGENYESVDPGDVIGGQDALDAFKAVDTEDIVKTLGYLGAARYLKVSCTGSDATGALFGVAAILGHTQQRPVRLREPEEEVE